MTERDRRKLWREIDQLQAEIDHERVMVENPACACGQLECDDCDIVQHRERLLGDYRAAMRKLTTKFPEVKFWPKSVA